MGRLLSEGVRCICKGFPGVFGERDSVSDGGRCSDLTAAGAEVIEVTDVKKKIQKQTLSEEEQV